MSLEHFADLRFAVAPDPHFVIRRDRDGKTVVACDVTVPDPTTVT